MHSDAIDAKHNQKRSVYGCGKVRIRSKRKAEIDQRKGEKREGVVFRVYYCEQCKSWHISRKKTKAGQVFPVKAIGKK